MPPETSARFRYGRDPLFLVCLATYVLNRALIKPHLAHYSPLFHGHLDDSLTVPVALPLYLLFYRWIGLRPDDAFPRWWEVATHLAVWELYFKWYGPLTLHKGAYDLVDVWCIGLGGVAAWMLWQIAALRQAVVA
jgi:hypothetical protein